MEERRSQRRQKLRWMAGVSRLMVQGQCQHRGQRSAAGRRWKQRRRLAQQLIDPARWLGRTGIVRKNLLEWSALGWCWRRSCLDLGSLLTRIQAAEC